MGMSIYMQRAYKIAEEYDKKLLATNFKGSDCVLIQEHDSFFFYRDAFVLKWTDPEHGKRIKYSKPLSTGQKSFRLVLEWYLVFTEHYGFHVFNAEDCHAYALKEKQIVEYERA